MANNVSLLILLLSFTYAVNTAGIKQEIVREANAENSGYKALIDRLDSLERAVAQHPKELEALRHEFKSEIDDLRQSHADEIASLKAEYISEISSLKHAKNICNDNIETPKAANILEGNVGAKHKIEEVNEKQVDSGITPINVESGDGEVMNAAEGTVSGMDEVSGPIPGFRGRSVQDKMIRQREGEPNVAFFATLSQSVAHLGQNQNVKFDTVITNIGNAYDKHSGTFRAPIAGIYTFSTTMVTDNRDSSHFGLYLNSQRLTVMWLHGAENGWDGSSNTVVLHLNPNDDVSVQQLDTDKAIYGNEHCMFSGFLVSPTEPLSSSIVGK